MKHFRRRLPLILAGAAMILLVSACGRVDLEDLTPAAVRTEIAGRPTPTPAPTVDPSQPTPTTGAGGVRTGEGNRAAGASLYNAQCSGCHEGRRAESLQGKSFVFEDIATWIRGGEGGPDGHPTYRPNELTDNNFRDILFYLETSQ
jgi:mono/diheme cytochrome c family protein